MPSEQEKLDFGNVIEQIAYEKKVTYIEAILSYCQETDLEESVAATLVSNSLKTKIEEQALVLHQLKNTSNRLPI